MSIFEAIIFGIIEGITEFLPISSTGHLIIANKIMGITGELSDSFNIIIQLGAILAVIFIYFDKLKVGINLWVKILISFLPIGIIGFIFSDEVKALFSVNVVAYAFIAGGIVFLIVEYFIKDKEPSIKRVEDISYKNALFIGLFQIFALIPGTSRSGATIIGALGLKISRKTAAEFSFLIAIPVMFATSGYDFLKHYDSFSIQDIYLLISGFLVSFVVAFLVIKLFIKFLENFTFVMFGWYRILFGITLLIFIQ